MKTSDYVLSESVSYNYGQWDSRVLPVGTFARPIEIQYVPKHVIEDRRYQLFDKEKEIFCYTSIGIIPIPRKSLRKI